MMRRAAFRRKEPHRISLVTERGLYPDEYIAKRHPLNQQFTAIRVDLARSTPPIPLDFVDIGAKLPVFVDRHSIPHAPYRSRFGDLAAQHHSAQPFNAF